MQNAQVKNEIRYFILENCLYGQDDAVLQDGISLLATGVIDSTGMLEIVSFVEGRYHITVMDDELVPENFDSVNNLCSFIMKKKNAQEARRIGHE